jgi:hypothetical protein
MIVIPKLNHWLRKIVLITERAKARRAESKIPASQSWSESKPPRGQDSDEVAAGKQQHVSGDGTDTLNHSVGSLLNLVRHLASRAAIPEQLPVWALRVDLGRAPAFVLTVVPFDQVRIGLGYRSESGQFAGSECALEGARKNLGQRQALQTISKPQGITLTIGGQR